MSRRTRAIKRDVLPDVKFGRTDVTKLINQVMLDGKKSIAEDIVYNAFDIASAKLSINAMELFDKVLENVKPVLETRARRVGGANYQVPVEVREDRRQTLAIRWLVTFSRKRNERKMENKLAAELVDAYNMTGGAVKRKEEMHRMAESNKAFAHYKI